MKEDILKYFETKVIPHIDELNSSNIVVYKDELEDFINAVVDALESGKMPKVSIVRVHNIKLSMCAYPF